MRGTVRGRSRDGENLAGGRNGDKLVLLCRTVEFCHDVTSLCLCVCPINCICYLRSQVPYGKS